MEAAAGGASEAQQRAGKHRRYRQHQPRVAGATCCHLTLPVVKRANRRVVVLQAAAVLIDQQLLAGTVALAAGQHIAAVMPARHGHVAGTCVDALLDDVGKQPLHRAAVRGHFHATGRQLADELARVAHQHFGWRGPLVAMTICVGPTQQPAPFLTLAIAGLGLDFQRRADELRLCLLAVLVDAHVEHTGIAEAIVRLSSGSAIGACLAGPTALAHGRLDRTAHSFSAHRFGSIVEVYGFDGVAHTRGSIATSAHRALG
ncbi:hypothetical protein XAUC_03270 [Xanthomonas citri pv. aurantifolii str. ICPB 10535]|nr:hypothetical protein XAUC_03270 [Xanthomonas citri pv. aurantifolii str. ICPB 10535]